jgi:syntaxin 7
VSIGGLPNGGPREDAESDGRHNLTEATRDMVKKSTEDVKTLAAFPAGGPHVSCLVWCIGTS